jgi:thiol-disulfide isomerase/thioredoxin
MMNKYFLQLVFAAITLLASQVASAVSAGGKMPDCALSPITSGQNTQLSQLKGKVTYVDFWASWCGPCAKSFSFLNQMHQELKDKGLQVVGVNLDENLDDGKTFLTNHPAEFTVMADMTTDKQCAKDFDVQGMPSSYIIDQNGAVHHVHMGFKDGEAKEIKAMVEKLLQ